MKVYLFRAFDARARDLILTENFHFSTFDKLNDPMEGSFKYFKDKFNQDLESIILEKQRCKICCFSKDYRSILMWTHYADNHGGVCIEVEIDRNLLESQNITQHEIKYVPHLKKDTFGIDVKTILSRKITKWKYEEEIRYITESEEKFHKIGIITAIILGKRFDIENNKDILKRLVCTRDIKFFETKLNFHTNQINLKSIDLQTS